MEKITIQGQAGTLQGAWHPVTGSEDCLVICHPHPLFDGTMDNKVVTTGLLCTSDAADVM